MFENKIKNIDIQIKKEQESDFVKPAIKEIIKKAIATQSYEVDGVSGASLTSEGTKYYAIEVSLAVHHTMGGVRINTNAEVLGKNGRPIKGLYVAGEITGGIHGANRIGENAVADITVFGKIAGENAATYSKSVK